MELVTKEDFRISLNYYALALADPKGGASDAPPPQGSKFFHFHTVFGKILQNNTNLG